MLLGLLIHLECFKSAFLLLQLSLNRLISEVRCNSINQRHQEADTSCYQCEQLLPVKATIVVCKAQLQNNVDATRNHFKAPYIKYYLTMHSCYTVIASTNWKYNVISDLQFKIYSTRMHRTHACHWAFLRHCYRRKILPRSYMSVLLSNYIVYHDAANVCQACYSFFVLHMKLGNT